MQALKASSVVDKVKGLLPFQTLPVFDLASDTADLGPNEVTKDSIKDVAENVKDGIDTASPGVASALRIQPHGQQRQQSQRCWPASRFPKGLLTDVCLVRVRMHYDVVFEVD